MEPKSTPSSESQHRKAPASELRQLDIFGGRWKIEGYNFPALPDAPPIPLWGEDHYQWLEGKYFLIDTWHHLVEGGGHQGLSVIGFDAQAQKLFTRNFDNLGFERKYWLEREQQTWKLVGFQERAVRQFSADDKSYEENWEVLTQNHKWIPLCTMRGRKVA